MKVMKYAERGVDGERRNAENIMQKFGNDFKEQILQIARDKAYDSYASGDWTSRSSVNEVLVVPIGEGCRSEQYFANMANIIGQEFSTTGATQTRLLDGKKCASCAYIGLLSSALDSAFCSIHILSTLRILYGKDREMKRGYILGLRSSGFGTHGNKNVLEMVDRTSFWFGVYTGARRAKIPKGDAFKQGFSQGARDGKEDLYSKGPKKLA